MLGPPEYGPKAGHGATFGKPLRPSAGRLAVPGSTVWPGRRRPSALISESRMGMVAADACCRRRSMCGRHLCRIELEPLGNGVVDALIGLVRDEPVDVTRRDTCGAAGGQDALGQLGDRVFEHLFAIHADEVVFGRQHVRAQVRTAAESCLDQETGAYRPSVKSSIDCEAGVAFGAFEDHGTGAVAEDDGPTAMPIGALQRSRRRRPRSLAAHDVPVFPGHQAGVSLGPDHQGRAWLRRYSSKPAATCRLNKKAAHCALQIQRRARDTEGSGEECSDPGNT